MEESGVEEENHICSSVALEEVWFSLRRLQCVVGNGICHLERVLLRPFSCAPTRCVDGCGRMLGNGPAEEGLKVLVD